MQQFVIEREVPGVGASTAAQLKEGSQVSCDALRAVGPDIHWVHSYVTDDKFYCVFRAPDEAMIREHAERAGVPADRISPVREVIDPLTAE